MARLVVDPHFHQLTRPDRLTFAGEFIPEFPTVGRQPINRINTISTPSSAIGSGVWMNGRSEFPINLRTTDNSDPELMVGQVYDIEGHLTGCNFYRVPNLTFVPSAATASTLVFRERIRVTGLGTVSRTRQFPIGRNDVNPLTEAIVEHQDERALGGRIRVRCLLGWRFCQIDGNVQLFDGSRIFYTGILNGYDPNSGRLIIEVGNATVNFVATLLDDAESSGSELGDDF
ncbi:hypothetical protein MJO28_010144 [Puccinia striiformis f. sp. tritici]|uniref:Uncharacterized protein n=3 Tax=Puccinia striiformis TaxID=27350 RepID=A0A0L0VSX6_9BASI|nr:hypothetical protein MJO28_010144 [Puccinia striiformis f. sp. tritici]KAI9625558.1 hypothetical protein KEM48_010820 [Puccinia striiformis f. sp. tritici PST-130]KNF02371.1 hypothetical protein PSTG_04279 [Puccinia striiformis f. sp. tritici PST-78]POW23119.1 hypothetical protein PSHT_00537 [Puccinia striiformis]